MSTTLPPNLQRFLPAERVALVILAAGSPWIVAAERVPFVRPKGLHYYRMTVFDSRGEGSEIAWPLDSVTPQATEGTDSAAAIREQAKHACEREAMRLSRYWAAEFAE